MRAVSAVDPPLAMTVDLPPQFPRARRFLDVCQSQFESLSNSFRRIAMFLPRKLFVFVTREFLFPE